MDTRQQHFTLDFPSAPIEVFADAERLAQVFCNLLDNASKFTPAGGHIALRVALQEQSVAVTVSDTGVGITPADLPDIFDIPELPAVRSQRVHRDAKLLDLAPARGHAGTRTSTRPAHRQ